MGSVVKKVLKPFSKLLGGGDEKKKEDKPKQAPSQPEPEVPTESEDDARRIQEAKDAKRRRMAATQGRRSTILTGPSGAYVPNPLDNTLR